MALSELRRRIAIELEDSARGALGFRDSGICEKNVPGESVCCAKAQGLRLQGGVSQC